MNDNLSFQAGYGDGMDGDGPGSPEPYVMTGLTFVFGKKKVAQKAPEAPSAPAPVPEPVAAPAPPAPAPEPVAAPAPPAPVLRIVLESIHFKFDKSDLTDEAKTILANNAEKLKEYPDAQLLIEGNTCSIGPDGYNYKLGVRRARAAKRFLVEQMGIASEKLELTSYGELQPDHTNKTRKGRRMNRRGQRFIFQAFVAGDAVWLPVLRKRNVQRNERRKRNQRGKERRAQQTCVVCATHNTRRFPRGAKTKKPHTSC